MNFPPMRPQSEIQFAHNMLMGLYTDQSLVEAVVPESYRAPLALAADALCWVLHQDTGEHPDANAANFAILMRLLRADLEQLGWDWEPRQREYTVEE